jgi:hypothetical protein
MSGYIKRVQWLFEVEGFEDVELAAEFGEYKGTRIAEIEETFEGMQGLAFRSNKTLQWHWDEEEVESFTRYGEDGLAAGILEHLNKHGEPASRNGVLKKTTE